MKLSSKAISKINVRAKNMLALELDCSVQTVERWIKENEENGKLTTAKAVQVISEVTGLGQSQILEEDSEKEAVTNGAANIG